MNSSCPAKLAIRALCLGLALFFAPGAWAQSGSSSSNSCSSGSSTSGGGSTSSGSSASSACAFGGGLQSTVVSVTTLAVPLAISNALSGALSGRLGPGVARSSLGPKNQTGMAAAGGAEKWNAWAAYGRSNVSYSFAPLNSSGDVDLVLGGIDYTFNNNVIVGVAASWDRTRIDTTFNRGTLDGRGYMIAPYLAWQIDRSWIFDASVGIGRADLDQVDTSAGFVAGSTRDDRTFGSLSLSYVHAFDKLTLTGKGSYLTAKDKVDAFLLTDGTLTPQSTTRLSQIRLGGQLAYGSTGVVPFAGLYYIHDTQRADQLPVGGFLAANDRDAWQVALGLNFISKGPVYGGVLFTSEQGRSEVKNDQLMLNLGIRF